MAEFSTPDPNLLDDDVPELTPVDEAPGKPRPPRRPDRRKPRPPRPRQPELTEEQRKLIEATKVVLQVDRASFGPQLRESDREVRRREQEKANRVIDAALGKEQRFKRPDAPESLDETRARLARERRERVPTRAQFDRMTPGQRLRLAEQRAADEGRPLVAARASTPEEIEYTDRLEALEQMSPAERALYYLDKLPDEAFQQATEAIESGLYETPSAVKGLADLFALSPTADPQVRGLATLLGGAAEGVGGLIEGRRRSVQEQIKRERREREFLKPSLTPEQQEQLGPFVRGGGEVLQAFGSSVPLIAAGAAGGQLGLASRLTSGVGGFIQGVGQTAEEFDAAKSRDPERRNFALLFGGLTGATEALGLEGALDKLGLGKPFRKKALDILQDSGQEAFQEWLGNVNAAYVGAYDPLRPLSKDVAKSAILGAIISGGFQAMSPGGPGPGPAPRGATGRLAPGAPGQLGAAPEAAPTGAFPLLGPAATQELPGLGETSPIRTLGPAATQGLAPDAPTTDVLQPIEDRETAPVPEARAMAAPSPDAPDFSGLIPPRPPPERYQNEYLQERLDEEGIGLTTDDVWGGQYYDRFSGYAPPNKETAAEDAKVRDLIVESWRYGQFKAWTESPHSKYVTKYFDRDEADREAVASGGNVRAYSTPRADDTSYRDIFPDFAGALRYAGGSMTASKAYEWADLMIRDIEAGKLTWSQLGLDMRDPQSIPRVLEEARAFKDWYVAQPARVTYYTIDEPVFDRFDLAMDLQKKVFRQDARLTRAVADELGVSPGVARLTITQRASFYPETSVEKMREFGVNDPATLDLVAKRSGDRILLNQVLQYLQYSGGPAGTGNRMDAVARRVRQGQSKLFTQLPPTLQEVVTGPERQENLDAFLAESKAKHSDGSPIVGFMPATLGVEPDVIRPELELDQMNFGNGIYLEQDSEKASEYTQGRSGIGLNEVRAHPDWERRKQVAQFDEFWSYAMPGEDTEADFTMAEQRAGQVADESIRDEMRNQRLPNVRPFYMNITNPFDMNAAVGPEFVERAREAMADQAGGDYLPEDFLVGFEEDNLDERTGTVEAYTLFSAVRDQVGVVAAQDLLKDMGYDGITLVNLSDEVVRGVKPREFATEEQARAEADRTGGILEPPSAADQSEFDMTHEYDVVDTQQELNAVIQRMFAPGSVAGRAAPIVLTPSSPVGWRAAGNPTVTGNDILAEIYNYVDRIPPDERGKPSIDLVMDVMREWGFDVLTNYNADGSPLQLRPYRGESGWKVRGSRKWVAFYADQIKSSIGNVGTFDAEEQSVRAAQGGPLTNPDSYTPGALREMERRANDAGRPIVLTVETKRAFEQQMEVAKDFMMTPGLDPETLQSLSDRYTLLSQAVEEAANLPTLITPQSLREYVGSILWYNQDAVADYLSILEPAPGSRAPEPTDEELAQSPREEPKGPLDYSPYRLLVPKDEGKAPVLYAPESLFKAIGSFVTYTDDSGKDRLVADYGVNINVDDLPRRYRQIEAASEPMLLEIDRYFMSPQEASEAIAQLKTLAILSGQRGISTVSVINTNAIGKVLAEGLIQHETFHAGQQAAALATIDKEVAAAMATGVPVDSNKFVNALLFLHDPDWAENHPLVQRVMDEHQWLVARTRFPVHTAAMEMAAYIAGGDADILGLSPQDAASYLLDYLENIVENRGADALLTLERVAHLNEYTQYAIDSVKERYLDPLGGHGRAERSFARGERDVLSVPVPRPELEPRGPDLGATGGGLPDVAESGVISLGSQGETAPLRGEAAGEDRASRAGDLLKAAWGWIKGEREPREAAAESGVSDNVEGIPEPTAPAEDEYYEEEGPGLDEILNAPSPPPPPGAPPLFQQFLQNEIVVDLVESFNSAVVELAASDPEIRLLPTVPPFMQLGELMRQRPELFETGLVQQKLAENNLNMEMLSRLTEEFASQMGRGLSYFSRLQATWEEIYRSDAELAREYAKYGVRQVGSRKGGGESATGPQAFRPFEASAAVIPPATLARMALKDLEAGVIGQGWWARSGDTVRKMYLNQMKVFFNNVITTTGRVPLALADGLSSWALGFMQPGRYGQGFTIGERLTAASRARRASLKAIANVLVAARPGNLIRAVRSPMSLEYNQSINLLEQNFPGIHQKLHQPSSQIVQSGIPNMVGMTLQVIEGNINTLDQQAASNRANAQLVGSQAERTRLIQEANKIERKARELRSRYDALRKRNDFNNSLLGQAMEKTDWVYGLMLQPQTWQEYFFRRPYFVGALENELAVRGLPALGQLTQQGRIEEIPQEAIDSALDSALEFTYAYGPKQDSKGVENAAYHIIRALNHPALGPLGPLLGVPFARAMYNGLLFAHDYMGVGMMHAGPKVLFDFMRDPRGLERKVTLRDMQILGRGTAGMIMFGLAWFLRRAVGGDEWYELKTGMKDDKGRPIMLNVRNLWPFAGFFWLADRTQRIKDGRMGDVKLSEETAELFLGMQRSPEAAGSIGALVDIFGDRSASEEEGKLLRASEAGGRLLSIPLTPFLNLRDLVATFQEEENKRLDTRDVPGLGKFSSRLLGPSMERLPWLSGKLQPWQPPLSSAPAELSSAPALGQLGLKLQATPNFAHSEMKRLGLSPYKWLKPDRDAVINRRQFEVYAKLIEALAPVMEQSQEYHSLSDQMKVARWELLLRGTADDPGVADFAREAGLEANPVEAAKRGHKRELNQEMGPEMQKGLGLAPDKMTPVP